MTDDELNVEMGKWLSLLEKVGASDENFTSKEADCPFCGGLLSVTVTKSRYNGHLRCQCSKCKCAMFE